MPTAPDFNTALARMLALVDAVEAAERECRTFTDAERQLLPSRQSEQEQN